MRVVIGGLSIDVLEWRISVLQVMGNSLQCPIGCEEIITSSSKEMDIDVH